VVIISDGRGINKVGTSLKHVDLNGFGINYIQKKKRS
jgi:hypothetical protein